MLIQLAFEADNVKNILYILPALSILICAIYVKYLNRQTEEETATKPSGSDWRNTRLFGGAVKGPAGAHAIQLGADEDETVTSFKYIGLVIDYSDAGLEAHARKGKFTGSASVIKKTISEVLCKNGLLTAHSGLKASKEPRSSIMFTGSVEKMKKAVWQIRETMPWVRSIQGIDDCGVAYTVQQVGRGLKTRIKFEPCLILFNQE